MRNIADNVEVVTELIKQITKASQEQSMGISDVNQAIADIDEISQDNTRLVAMASESTAKPEEQTASLGAAVSVFKTLPLVTDAQHLHLASSSNDSFMLAAPEKKKVGCIRQQSTYHRKKPPEICTGGFFGIAVYFRLLGESVQKAIHP